MDPLPELSEDGRSQHTIYAVDPLRWFPCWHGWPFRLALILDPEVVTLPATAPAWWGHIPGQPLLHLEYSEVAALSASS